MIGAKTLGSLTLVILGLVLGLSSGVLRPERLMMLTHDTAFLIGVVAVPLATLAFRFFGLHQRSEHYFRFTTDPRLWEGEAHFLGTEGRRLTLGLNGGDAFDLRPRSHFAACLSFALVVGLIALDGRSVALLRDFPRTFTAAGSTVCPDPEAKAPAVTSQDPNAPGCALLRRAYALGYAKSLGDCGDRSTAATSAAICTLRQRDEPFTHYAYRLLIRFSEDVRAQLGGEGYFKRMRRDLDERLARMESLYAGQRQVMFTTPHASHHIWTDLPEPVGGAFEERTCVDRYRSLPHRPQLGGGQDAQQRASKVFEHVLGQLLFETRYEPAAGYCREYHVHWGASRDACQKLVAAPEAFLAEQDALVDVRAALERYRLGKESDDVLRRQAEAGKAGHSTHRALEPSAFLSFHCYVAGEATPEAKLASLPFQLQGHALSAQVVLAPAPAAGESALHVPTYSAVANLLAPSFHYGVLLSEGGLEARPPGGMDDAFARADFLLSRLHGLASLDIFLEPEWIATRPDLLDVYPYHLHLQNYVQLFRRQYLRAKGRL